MQTLKNSLGIVLILLIVGCSSSTPNVPTIEPSAPPVVEVKQNKVEEAKKVLVNSTRCVHKYDDSLNFEYSGQIKGYIHSMFGKMIRLFEVTTIDGEKRVLNGDELANYNCKKVQRVINISTTLTYKD